MEKMSEDFTKNSNLVQWLNKRNIDIDLFTKLIAGKVPIKTLDTGGEDMFSQDYPNIGGFSTNGSGTGNIRTKYIYKYSIQIHTNGCTNSVS